MKYVCIYAKDCDNDACSDKYHHESKTVSKYDDECYQHPVFCAYAERKVQCVLVEEDDLEENLNYDCTSCDDDDKLRGQV